MFRRYTLIYFLTLGILFCNSVFIVLPNIYILNLVFGLVFTVFLPGILLLIHIPFKEISFTDFVVLSVPVSLAILLTIGLFLNSILPHLFITQPLSRLTLLAGLDTYFLVSIVYFVINNKKISITNVPHISLRWVCTRLFVILPILSIIGALLLNNGVSNMIAIIVQILVILVVFIVSLLSEKKSIPYEWIMYMVSLSLIYGYSARSNYLVGWDIQSEYRVFQHTLEKLLWSKYTVNHAYNTTLAVTILPTIIQQFTGVSALVVFKYLYPIFFSFSVPLIFIILRNFFTPSVSFLSSFFFVIQFQFFQQMPALARQEIAILFFFTAIYFVFTIYLQPKWQTSLFILFGLTTIVSHYSTAYIMVFIFVCVYLFQKIFITINSITKRYTYQSTIISFKNILVLSLSIFLWYGIYTGSASNLEGVAKQITANFSRLFSEEGKSEQARIAIVGTSKAYTQKDLQTYSQSLIRSYTETRPWINSFGQEIEQKYPAKIKYTDTIPYRFLSFRPLVINLVQFNQKLIKFSIVIILFIMSTYILVKRSKQQYLNFVFFSWSFLLLVFAAAIIPFVSVVYNIERVYQQALLFLGVWFVYGVTNAAGLLRIRFIASPIVIALFSLYFASYSGLITTILGGSPTLNLHNFGDEYERFYIKRGESTSAKWLDNNSPNRSVFQSDYYGWLRLQSNSNLDWGLLTDLSPSIIDRNGYVFTSYANLIKDNVRGKASYGTFVYSFEKKFYDENKNVVYSSGTSLIYK